MAIPTPKSSERIRSNERLPTKDLIEFMNHHGVSDNEFAEILGVTLQAVRLWKSGQREFSVLNSRLIRMFIKYPNLIREF